MSAQLRDELTTSLFDNDSLEQAAECLRLTIAMLAKHQAPATPVNYSLFYNHVAGKNLRLNDKLDAILQEDPLSPEELQDLFIRVFYDNDLVMESLRQDLLSTVAQVIGSLVDIAGKAHLSNDRLERHVERLASSSNPKDVLAAVSSIVADTRDFVAGTRQLEGDLQASAEDMSKLKEELVTARREATMDALTGLNNRRSFDLKLEMLLAASAINKDDSCIIMLDIDHFKMVNDTYGHLIGDKVLSNIAMLLKDKMRGSDFTARYGGEEFVILLPNTQTTNAFTVAEGIRLAIERLNLINKRTGRPLGRLTASFGVAGHRKDETSEDLINRCDRALYQAKRLGRNRSVLAD